MTVSAIIAIYKPKWEVLRKCLECVLPQVDEVIICGDMDSPWPPQVNEHAKIKFVRHPQHSTGYGKKATLGAMNSTSDVLHFLNDDLFVQPDVVQGCLKELVNDVAIVAHTLRFPNGLIQYAGKFRFPGERMFHHLDFKKRDGSIKVPTEQESACGASMFVLRSAFMEVNGFDESFKLYADDDDIVMKIRQKGYRAIFTPLVEGIHISQASMALTPNWRKIMAASNRIFAQKWKQYFEDNPNPNNIGKFR